MREGCLDGVHALDDNIFVGAGGLLQNISEGHACELRGESSANLRKHGKCSLMGQCRGDSVQESAKNPEQRHPRNTVHAVRLVCRVIHKPLHHIAEIEVGNKAADYASERKNDAYDIVNTMNSGEFHHPRKRRAFLLFLLTHRIPFSGSYW